MVSTGFAYKFKKKTTSGSSETTHAQDIVGPLAFIGKAVSTAIQ
jgi:hypothetical protein